MDLNPNRKFTHVIITGASSGIGEALALGFARYPGISLGLTGRDSPRLEAVAAQARALGAAVETARINVTDARAMENWLLQRDEILPVDLVIANAGISAGTGGVLYGEKPEQVHRVFDINLTGVLNTIDPLLPRMIERGRGHVALMSSLAGFRGWPGAPAYCASKAAIRVYGEGLRGALASTGVRVSVICPGFVKSRMTDANDFSMPLIVPAEKAAHIIIAGLEKNRGRIAFPLQTYFFSWLLGALPDFIAQKILKSAPAKKISA